MFTPEHIRFRWHDPYKGVRPMEILCPILIVGFAILLYFSYHAEQRNLRIRAENARQIPGPPTAKEQEDFRAMAQASPRMTAIDLVQGMAVMIVDAALSGELPPEFLDVNLWTDGMKVKVLATLKDRIPNLDEDGINWACVAFQDALAQECKKRMEGIRKVMDR